jgi:hypothetical protein
MKAQSLLSAALLCAISTPLVATPPLVLYPERIGAETARFYRGSAAVMLKTPAVTVEIRPMPVEKGRVTLAIAVFNQSRQPGNFGVENVTATVNGMPTAIPSAAQLADDAQRKARNAKIGAALFAGAIAGVASTAHNEGTYYRHVGGPHGGYTRAIHWEDNTPGVIGATAAVAGGALVIHGIDKKLDYTLDQLGSQILQTTTIDPGSSFGGMVVIPTEKRPAYPAEVRLQVSFNGHVYPFAFRLTPSGMNVPPPLPAAAQQAALPAQPQPGPMGPSPAPYPGGQ